VKNYAVYILRCSDNTYYTGITNDIDRRFAEHMEGDNPISYTFKRRPLEVVFYQDFEDVTTAIDAEKQIKKWSVAKKKALIEGRYDLLPDLSKKNFKY